MSTQYEILIKYANKLSQWDSFFERFVNMAGATARLARVKKIFPKSQFKIISVEEGDSWQKPSGK